MRCPAGAIFGEKKQRHMIHVDLCLDCRVCGRWCPSGAVLDAKGEPVPRIKPKDMPRAEVDIEECTGCGLCESVCPFHSIEMVLPDVLDDAFGVQRVAKVNRKKCVGCQLCEDICIKGAVRIPREGMDRPGDLQLASFHRTHAPR